MAYLVDNPQPRAPTLAALLKAVKSAAGPRATTAERASLAKLTAALNAPRVEKVAAQFEQRVDAAVVDLATIRAVISRPDPRSARKAQRERTAAEVAAGYLARADQVNDPSLKKGYKALAREAVPG
jgi:hypothetical protein